MDVGTFLHRSFDNRNTGAPAVIMLDTNENIEAKVDEERNCLLLTVIIAKNEQ